MQMGVVQPGDDEPWASDGFDAVDTGWRRDGRSAIGDPELSSDTPVAIDDVDLIAGGCHGAIALSTALWTCPLVATIPGSSSG